MVYNPNFGMGVPRPESQVILTPSEIRAQERARFERAQARVERQRAAQRTALDQAAQQLVDHFTANPLMWDGVDRYAYGDMTAIGTPRDDGRGSWAHELTRNPHLQPGSVYATDGTQYGSIAGSPEGGWVPTLDEARQIMLADRPSRAGTPSNALSATAAIRSQYGNLPDPFINYLASQAQMQTPTGGDAWRPTLASHFNLGIDARGLPRGAQTGPNSWQLDEANFPTFNAVDAPFLQSNLNMGARRAFDDIQRGLVDRDLASTARQQVAPNPFMDWQQRANQTNEHNAARNQTATDAYQRFTLGNNYGGGVLDAQNVDRYSAPFGGAWGILNPTGSYGGSQSGFGQPQENSFAPNFVRQPNAETGWGGPWGAKNPWSPS